MTSVLKHLHEFGEANYSSINNRKWGQQEKAQGEARQWCGFNNAVLGRFLWETWSLHSITEVVLDRRMGDERGCWYYTKKGCLGKVEQNLPDITGPVLRYGKGNLLEKCREEMLLVNTYGSVGIPVHWICSVSREWVSAAILRSQLIITKWILFLKKFKKKKFLINDYKE